METPNKLKGECMEMCPETEIILREKEGLLHILEVLPGTERHNKPLADKKKVVKSFSRSAAGKQMRDPKNLRPPHVLLKTLEYLFQVVMVNKKVPWHVTYDYIMDRLRSVRQDMIIQNVSVAESICILQPVVRFYAYAAYRSCNEPIANFDPYINQIHLQECLKRLLSLYDECDYFFERKDSCKDSYCMNKLQDTRPHFEALYLVLNLGNSIALTRALSLPKIWKDHVVKLSMILSINHCQNNFVRTCRIIKELPVLILGVAAIHLPEIRRKALQVMSVAYNSKNLSFPLEELRKLLMYKDLEHAISDCVYYGLKQDETHVRFVKTDFDSSKVPVPPTHLPFIDQALKNIKICDLILCG